MNTPAMRTIATALALTALLAAGCGGDDADTGPATETQARTQQERPAGIEHACAQAARDLKDPVAFERRLPESQVPTSSTDPQAKREAAALRGTKEILQRVYDAATQPEHRTYRDALRDLIQELDDAELAARQEYEIDDTEAKLRARWRRAERAAPGGCRAVRRPA